MAQDIRETSIMQLRLQVYKLHVEQIKRLIQAIYDYKRNMRTVMTGDVLDLERKETILEAELSRRGYLNPKENEDYHKWKFKQNRRKVF